MRKHSIFYKEICLLSKDWLLGLLRKKTESEGREDMSCGVKGKLVCYSFSKEQWKVQKESITDICLSTRKRCVFWELHVKGKCSRKKRQYFLLRRWWDDDWWDVTCLVSVIDEFERDDVHACGKEVGWEVSISLIWVREGCVLYAEGTTNHWNCSITLNLGENALKWWRHSCN